jgi:cephalosporin hydroxylase
MDPIEAFDEEVRQNVLRLQEDQQLEALSRRWMIASLPGKYSYNFRWLGRPIIQYPQDIVALQELVWIVRPDLIIETGVAHGGSLILHASLLALLDLCDGDRSAHTLPHRSVLGIDIEIRPHNREAIESHPLASRISLLEGSSTATDVVTKVREVAMGRRAIMVLLDSNHTREHVLRELENYAPLVSPGSYCIVYDTVVENVPAPVDRPWRPGNSPMNAVDDYIKMLEGGRSLASDGKPLHFAIDRSIDAKLMISVAPRGYLRRI